MRHGQNEQLKETVRGWPVSQLKTFCSEGRAWRSLCCDGPSASKCKGITLKMMYL
jgi:hypothetical protein